MKSSAGQLGISAKVSFYSSFIPDKDTLVKRHFKSITDERTGNKAKVHAD